VNDAKVVEIVNSREDPAHKGSGIGLGVVALLDDLVKQLTTRHELSHNVEVVVGLEEVLKGNDVGVVDLSKDVHFGLQAVEILLDVLLIDDLDGKVDAILFASSEPDDGEGASAQLLAKCVDVLNASLVGASSAGGPRRALLLS